MEYRDCVFGPPQSPVFSISLDVAWPRALVPTLRISCRVVEAIVDELRGHVTIAGRTAWPISSEGFDSCHVACYPGSESGAWIGGEKGQAYALQVCLPITDLCYGYAARSAYAVI